MPRILVLGGTSEASALARALAERGDDAVFSYAGRTAAPVDQPLPTRIGGFGGADGLARYLQDAGVTHVIDATHPFAAQMSRNAVTACAEAQVALVAFERAPWQTESGDDWRCVPDLESAVAGLPDAPSRVFLAIGKQTLEAFAARPQHQYLLRLVDAPDGPLPLPNAEAVIARGPFDVAGDRALLVAHDIDVIVAKNSGGTGAAAKMQAARQLGVPVILIERPKVPTRPVLARLEDVLNWLDHPAHLGV